MNSAPRGRGRGHTSPPQSTLSPPGPAVKNIDTSSPPSSFSSSTSSSIPSTSTTTSSSSSVPSTSSSTIPTSTSTSTPSSAPPISYASVSARSQLKESSAASVNGNLIPGSSPSTANSSIGNLRSSAVNPSIGSSHPSVNSLGSSVGNLSSSTDAEEKKKVKKILLQLDVGLKNGGSKSIWFKEGDSPKDVATQFCAENDMAHLSGALSHHLEEQIKALKSPKDSAVGSH